MFLFPLAYSLSYEEPFQFRPCADLQTTTVNYELSRTNKFTRVLLSFARNQETFLFWPHRQWAEDICPGIFCQGKTKKNAGWRQYDCSILHSRTTAAPSTASDSLKSEHASDKWQETGDW